MTDLISHIPQVNYPLSHLIGHDSSGTYSRYGSMDPRVAKRDNLFEPHALNQCPNCIKSWSQGSIRSEGKHKEYSHSKLIQCMKRLSILSKPMTILVCPHRGVRVVDPMAMTITISIFITSPCIPTSKQG